MSPRACKHDLPDIKRALDAASHPLVTKPLPPDPREDLRGRELYEEPEPLDPENPFDHHPNHPYPSTRSPEFRVWYKDSSVQRSSSECAANSFATHSQPEFREQGRVEYSRVGSYRRWKTFPLQGDSNLVQRTDSCGPRSPDLEAFPSFPDDRDITESAGYRHWNTHNDRNNDPFPQFSAVHPYRSPGKHSASPLTYSTNVTSSLAGEVQERTAGTSEFSGHFHVGEHRPFRDLDYVSNSALGGQPRSAGWFEHSTNPDVLRSSESRPRATRNHSAPGKSPCRVEPTDPPHHLEELSRNSGQAGRLDDTQLPPPYEFQTHSNKHSNKQQYNPLNFVPGGSNPRGDIRLPEPVSRFREEFDSSLESYPQTPLAPVDESCADDHLKNSIPYAELPLESPRIDQKPRKKSGQWISLSFKKIFRSRSKSEGANCSANISLTTPRPNVVVKAKPKQRSPSPSPADPQQNPIFGPQSLPTQQQQTSQHSNPYQNFTYENSPYQSSTYEGSSYGNSPRQNPPYQSPSRENLQKQTRPQQSHIRPTMDRLNHLDPSSAMVALTKQKSEAIRLAREQEAVVEDMCRRAKSECPPYAFEELIGKGAYGRVYKGRQLPSQQLVAIKVMDVDNADYKAVRDFKDESIKDFIHETMVMKQARDAGAKNINMFIEAVSIHSQLWLVCEYCPGGSVKTLMRATGDKLDEKFIIPIARELAEGLRAIHDAGIIHRDIKAANILIHEEGRLEICDFGVAGVLQSKIDKRSTWIGTPHWMPPEMFPNRGGETHYGSEIDVWAYGCTLFECATGYPPNANLRERMQIGRQLNRFPPKLEDESYSEELRSLVAFALDSDPTTRPSMQQILDHPYIAQTSESYPTSSLSDLVRIYYQWAQRGGQRISLFNPGGAAAAQMPDVNESLDDGDWNFSTTDGFERRFSLIDLDQLSASLAELEQELIPTVPQPSSNTFNDITDDPDFSPEQQANFDERVKRGAAAMEGLFNESKPDYKYETKNDFVPVEQKQRFSSDLPLRTDTDRSSVASTFIDINLGVYDSAHYAAGSAANTPFQLADPNTIRANRSSHRLTRNSSGFSSDSQEQNDDPIDRGPRPPTMEWTFPASMQPEDDETTNDDENLNTDDRDEKRDTRAWKFPVMTADEDVPAQEEPTWSSEGVEVPFERVEPEDELTIRGGAPPLQRPPFGQSRGPQDYSLDMFAESRPSTATSARSTTSDADNDPFRFDRPASPPGVDTQRGPSSYDQFPPMVDTGMPEDYDHAGFPDPANGYDSHNWEGDLTMRSGSSGGQYSQSSVIEEGGSESASLEFPELIPPSLESLTEGASDDAVVSEMDRLLGDLVHGLAVTGETLGIAGARMATEPTKTDEQAEEREEMQ
ncbi:STE/STE20/YSK protein kinase [Polytolypa hystricis UAMH7299]|uniref:non-specific serine/threonine protein kinase n=1 Tax=Polytolypa hystricis (strain UAMH7299) TaxID=1447883 RepID=A0A2B7WKH8_POLH7|nr:STE/STE20/YSK protein kinase [Polytolypa hystricis UAMH7299]